MPILLFILNFAETKTEDNYHNSIKLFKEQL